jgi:hypothetical protein
MTPLVRLLLTTALGFALAAATPPALVAERFQADVKTLSAPGMKGRGTGSPQWAKAAKFLAAEFK